MPKSDTDKKSPKQNQEFRTHIPEPRWQQFASVAFVIVVVVVWIAIAIHQ